MAQRQQRGWLKKRLPVCLLFDIPLPLSFTKGWACPPVLPFGQHPYFHLLDLDVVCE